MPDLLALDWESHQLCGLDAEVSRGRVRVRRAFVLSWPEGVNAAEQPQQAAAWLKDELRKAGVEAKQVVVSLPREDVVVRKLDLPTAPDDELPDMVRLQAATASSTPLDRLLLDFLPLPGESDAGGRSVLLATIPKTTGDRIRATVQAAGLELVSIGMSPLGATELVARAEQQRGQSSDDPSLALARHGNRVEIALIQNRNLLFTHSTELFGDDEQEDIQRVLAEISRTQIALQRLLSGKRVARAWVFGQADENRPLREALASRLSCDVNALDPLADPDLALPPGDQPGSHALYAGPAGLLLAESGRLVPGLDFLNPRKPPVKKDTRKLKIAAAAAAVLLVTGLAWGSVKLAEAETDDEIAAKTELSQNLDENIERGAPLVEAAGHVGEWNGQAVGWLEQMQKLNQSLPGTDRIYLADYRFTPASGDNVGRVQATGYARERRDAETLEQRLADVGYTVLTSEKTLSRKDAEYPYRFDLNVQIPALKPASPATQRKRK